LSALATSTPSAAPTSPWPPWPSAQRRRTTPPGRRFEPTHDPLTPLGLGWISTLPVIEPPEADADTPPILETLTDSHISWLITLRLTHINTGTIPMPTRYTDDLNTPAQQDTPLRLVLTHPGHDLDPAQASQQVHLPRGAPPRLTGVDWPFEYFPGIVLTFSCARGSTRLHISSTLLDVAIDVNGVTYEHRFDLRALTRDTAPGQHRSGQNTAHGANSTEGTLSLGERLLAAIRRVGLLEEHGAAVLPVDQLPRLIYGPDAPDAAAAALEPTLGDLAARGTITDTRAWLTSSGFVFTDPRHNGEPIRVVRWAPTVTTRQSRPARPEPPAAPPADVHESIDEHDVADRFDYWVNPFLRRLQHGHQASDEAREQYRRARQRLNMPQRKLPAGFTLVSGHSRSRGSY
jgi:hypothetical protein